MATRNDITGAEIKSKILSKEGRDNWDNIFPPKKTAYEWLEELPDTTLLDPDGWRENDGVELTTRITRDDFNRRLSVSTVMCKIPTPTDDVL
jgi:hypothetical protein